MGIAVGRRGVPVGLGAVVLAGSVMAATGVGTGGGPLDAETGGSAVLGLMRPVGTTFSTGIPLSHRGRFTLHIESIRPLPRAGAQEGMPLRELTLTRDPNASPIGVVEGAGEADSPRATRRAVEGFEIPGHAGGAGTQRANAVATWEISRPGFWGYDGYEIVYRHGLVRHRMALALGTQGCTLSSEDCDAARQQDDAG